MTRLTAKQYLEQAGKPKTRRGDPQRFYEQMVLKYEGRDCLVWPYGKNANGYGRVNRNGKTGTVSRYVCIDTYGPPPSSEHDAAHSCGNSICCNPRHISWKTKAENQADRIDHGTDNRGERHGNSKLTSEVVTEIISLGREMTHAKIAARYGVARQTVTKICSGRAWGWLNA